MLCSAEVQEELQLLSTGHEICVMFSLTSILFPKGGSLYGTLQADYRKHQHNSTRQTDLVQAEEGQLKQVSQDNTKLQSLAAKLLSRAAYFLCLWLKGHSYSAVASFALTWHYSAHRVWQIESQCNSSTAQSPLSGAAKQ